MRDRLADGVRQAEIVAAVEDEYCSGILANIMQCVFSSLLILFVAMILYSDSITES